MTKQIKETKENILTMADGAGILLRNLTSFVYGASFMWVIYQAGLPVWNKRGELSQMELFIQLLPVAVMAVTSALVLGKYLKRLSGAK